MSLEILKKYKISAKKALGQNFLVNEQIVTEIAESIEVEWKNIIEVGPGYGALTEQLLEKHPQSLNLVELDSDMIEILNDRIKNEDFDLSASEFKINNIDVLKYEPTHEEYDVIANIPYYITSPILQHFLYKTEFSPKKMVILMQDDVGQKILGKGKNKSSVLSLFIEKKCTVSEVIKVPKENFIPAPKVESAVLLFETHWKFNETKDDIFLSIIKKWFSEPRKKMIKNLIKGGFQKDIVQNLFEKMNISENTRAEDLNIEQWIEVTEFLSRT